MRTLHVTPVERRPSWSGEQRLRPMLRGAADTVDADDAALRAAAVAAAVRRSVDA